MKYFGTDGIRLENTNELINLAKGVAFALYKKGAKRVVLGKDSRQSGNLIAKAFFKQLQKHGIHTYYLGMVPTACVAYYTVQKQADYGVVITASHNPANMNGIKVFGKNGEKLDDENETELEYYIDFLHNEQIKTSLQKQLNFKKTKKGKVWRLKPNQFEQLLCANACSLNGKKIVLDCANGAAKKLAPQIFATLGAKVIAINTGSGKKINQNCGAVFPQNLAQEVQKQKANLGFAFDGDADRCVCVLPDGQVLSGDNLLFALAKQLGVKHVVGTIYSNGALDNSLAKHGITLHRSNVGDQEVKQLMNQIGCLFGGERSGHFIFSNLLPTGDGILTALQVCRIEHLEKKCLFKKMPSVTVNLKTKNKTQSVEKLAQIKQHFEELFGKEGRIVLRPSGTEDLVRILVEHKKSSVAKRVANALVRAHEEG